MVSTFPVLARATSGSASIPRHSVATMNKVFLSVPLPRPSTTISLHHDRERSSCRRPDLSYLADRLMHVTIPRKQPCEASYTDSLSSYGIHGHQGSWFRKSDGSLIRLGVDRPSRLGRNRKSSPKASTDVPMGRATNIGVRHTSDPRVQREHVHLLPWRAERVRQPP
jgi:hypothetical protein